MTEPDIVAELESWTCPEDDGRVPMAVLKRARDEIVALRERLWVSLAVDRAGETRAIRAEALEEAAQALQRAGHPTHAPGIVRALKDKP